ncbi:MAG: hypothetical protein MJ165_03445 [Alphaproteobacteria bacterium]|nr:hypothetical protein [Alphaproteobacteria bacterium]
MTREEFRKINNKNLTLDLITYAGCCFATGIFIGNIIKEPNFPDLLASILTALSATRLHRNVIKDIRRKVLLDNQNQK